MMEESRGNARKRTAIIPDVRRFDGTDFVTGLRAIAALMVLSIHTGGLGLRTLAWWGSAVADLGRTGVYIFFVISGFSLASALKKRTYEPREFMIRRIARIVPLYYFWITCAYIWRLVSSEENLEFWNLVTHLVFLEFLIPKYSNSILSVEWSIPVEIFWYCLFPGILAFMRRFGSGKVVLIALLGSWFIIGLGALYASPDLGLALNHSPAPYSFCFALGAYGFEVRQRGNEWRFGKLYATTLIAAVLLQNFLSRVAVPEVILISTATFFLLTNLSDGPRISSRFLCSKILLRVGVLSYGIYLSHVLVMGWIQYFLGSQTSTVLFAMTFLCSALISHFLYSVMEVPCKRFILRRACLLI